MFRFSAVAETMGYPPGVMSLGLSDFIVESEFSNLVDIRLIVESYVWGRGQNTLPRVKSDTVIITDVNKQGKYVMDDLQIQTG